MRSEILQQLVQQRNDRIVNLLTELETLLPEAVQAVVDVLTVNGYRAERQASSPVTKSRVTVQTTKRASAMGRKGKRHPHHTVEGRNRFAPRTGGRTQTEIAAAILAKKGVPLAAKDMVPLMEAEGYHFESTRPWESMYQCLRVAEKQGIFTREIINGLIHFRVSGKSMKSVNRAAVAARKSKKQEPAEVSAPANWVPTVPIA